MIDRYLPVPVWNNRLGHWEPVDFRHGTIRTCYRLEE